MKDNKAIVNLLSRVADVQHEKDFLWSFNALATLLDALDQRKTSLKTLSAQGDKTLQTTIEALGKVFTAARGSALSNDPIKERRLAALQLLGRGPDRQREDIETLAGLLVPQTDRDVQAAAVAVLGKLSDARVAGLLVRGWKGYGPALRSQVLDALMGRNDRALALLDALEAKTIAVAELDAARRQRLLNHKGSRVKERAAKLLGGAVATDRQKVVDSFLPVLKLAGNHEHGAKVFAKTCATCHRLGDVGHAVGPDLASVGDKSPPGLLIAILDPNRVVEARYINYRADLKNGLTFNGVVGSETSTSISLVEPDGKQHVILRTDLDELVSTGKSLMPEGLEKDLSHQDIADVIVFIRATGARPK